MAILLYLLSVVILYLGFYAVEWLGLDHWATPPTIYLIGSLFILHFSGFILKIINKKKAK